MRRTLWQRFVEDIFGHDVHGDHGLPRVVASLSIILATATFHVRVNLQQCSVVVLRINLPALFACLIERVILFLVSQSHEVGRAGVCRLRLPLTGRQTTFTRNMLTVRVHVFYRVIAAVLDPRIGQLHKILLIDTLHLAVVAAQSEHLMVTL